MSDGAATERMLLTGIGELVTNDPAPGRDGGPLGILRDAAVLVEDGRVAWTGPATHATEHLARRDEREDRREAEEHRGIWDADIEVLDVGGRAMIPGFVDSHTHLVFGGDRAEEFAARMAGRRYEAGGIRSTVAATRAATDDELRARLAGFVAELHAQGTTTFEVKSGYGLSVADEERLVRLAREVTEEVTFLGAHVVPAEYTDDPEEYVDLVVGEMLAACAPHARWVDAFCERGAFTPEQSRRVLEAGAAANVDDLDVGVPERAVLLGLAAVLAFVAPCKLLGRVRGGTDPRDATVLDEHGGVADDAERSALAVGRGIVRHQFGDAGEQHPSGGPAVAHASSIGTRSPRSRATSTARS